jgi:hypothetical protein
MGAVSSKKDNAMTLENMKNPEKLSNVQQLILLAIHVWYLHTDIMSKKQY